MSEAMDMRRIAMAAGVLVVAALTLGFGQEKPDFSGTWTMVDEPRSRSTTMIVTQSSESMMLEVTPRGKDTVRYVFRLYDVTSANPAPSGEGAPPATGSASRATWEGAKLVLSTFNPGAARVLRQTWSLIDGDLVITLAEIDQATGAVLRETKQTFKRG